MKDKQITEVFRTARMDPLKKAGLSERMLAGKKRGHPVRRKIAVFALTLFAVAGCLILPWAAPERQKPGAAPSLEAQGGKVLFTVYAEAQKKEISLSEDAVRITLENGDKYRSDGYGGGGDGNVMRYDQEVDFNIRCAGRPDIKRVTYTAHNCKFLKKTFFDSHQVENGEASKYADGAIWGETQEDGTEINWGFASIGYVYSADFLEEVNLTNFGLKIEFTDENAEEYKPFSQEEMKKENELRADAFRKAFIIADIELENGEKIQKKIRIGLAKGRGNVTAWVEDPDSQIK